VVYSANDLLSSNPVGVAFRLTYSSMAVTMLELAVK